MERPVIDDPEKLMELLVKKTKLLNRKVTWRDLEQDESMPLKYYTRCWGSFTEAARIAWRRACTAKRAVDKKEHEIQPKEACDSQHEVQTGRKKPVAEPRSQVGKIAEPIQQPVKEMPTEPIQQPIKETLADPIQQSVETSTVTASSETVVQDIPLLRTTVPSTRLTPIYAHEVTDESKLTAEERRCRKVVQRWCGSSSLAANLGPGSIKLLDVKLQTEPHVCFMASRL